MEERHPAEDQEEELELWLVEHRKLYEISPERKENKREKKKNKKRRARRIKRSERPINVGSKRRICPTCGERSLDRTIQGGMCLGCQVLEFFKSLL